MAFFPFLAIGGDILFDSEDLEFYEDRGDFQSVGIHEIGHTLGLDHVDIDGAVMRPIISGQTDLGDDDVDGITQIYGDGSGPRILTLDFLRPDLNILSSLDDLRIRGNAGSNEIRGGGGDERIFGFRGDDFLFGRGGDDTLLGGSGNDRLGGFGGNDLLKGGAGVDSLFGALGDDTLRSGRTDNFDRLVGARGDDSLVGGIGDQLLEGGTGRDTIVALGGGDTIFGGIGSDMLRDGAGDDRFVFSSARDGKDVIRGGFDLDGDTIAFETRTGVSGMADLDIRAFGDDTLIRYGEFGANITISDLDASKVTAEIFDFI